MLYVISFFVGVLLGTLVYKFSYKKGSEPDPYADSAERDPER